MFVQVLSTGEVWKLALCLYDLSTNLSPPIERAQRQACFGGPATGWILEFLILRIYWMWSIHPSQSELSVQSD